jgi:hypothetical protein
MMNEQIQILFKLIRKQKHTSNLMSNPPQVRYSYTINEEDIEKFAELIVRECAGVAEVSMPINSYPDDRLTVKNNVLKHFGVEE